MKKLHMVPASYTYKLKQRDKLIIHQNNINTYIIIEGVLVVHKVFSNQERYAICILSAGDIATTPFGFAVATNYFYEIESLSTSYILSCCTASAQSLKPLISMKYSSNTLNHHDIIEILAHKNTKRRIIHVFLILSELFGEYKKNFLTLNLSISYQTLGSIIGTNKNTINKLIRELEKNNLLIYSKDQITINNLIDLSQHGLHR
uniref:Global nitrogen transcriptional regulator n=1 Tax=Scinaia undulata TaxID=1884664 RepID=A0A1G4NXS1_9FLOR|nr:Global nitrogen transcriptional regulator [Scinaia undulata]SCW23480.1 Global nitrogen transcriptional regulator [Scinaia undulata]